MAIYFFDENDDVILGFENIEFLSKDELSKVVYHEWKDLTDSKIENVKAEYENILADEYNYKVVADQNGIYPEDMGAAAERVFMT